MGKEKDFFKNFLDKGIKNEKLLLALLFMALLLVLAIPSGKPQSSYDKESSTQECNEQNIYTWYEEYLEDKLTQILNCTCNVGEVRVIVTLKNTAQKILETEGRSDDKNVVKTEEQNRKTPYVVQEKLPEVAGVVVVAKNGDNPVIIGEITQAVEALLSVSTHRIKVLKMK